MANPEIDNHCGDREIERLRAEVRKLKREKKSIVSFAVKLLGANDCERHQQEAQDQTFTEFDRSRRFCGPCVRDALAREAVRQYRHSNTAGTHYKGCEKSHDRCAFWNDVDRLGEVGKQMLKAAIHAEAERTRTTPAAAANSTSTS